MRDAHERAWQPTRTSTALALVVTVATLALVLRQVPAVVVPVVIGGVGAVCLAAALWLVAGESSPLAAFGAGLLSIPAGAGLVGSGHAAAIMLVEVVFPVEETALISLGSLVVAGHVGVVLGCFVAVLGASLGIRGVTYETLRQYTRIAFATGLVPVLVGLALVALALAAGTTPGVAVARLVGAPLGTLLAPGPVALYLGFALFCLALTGLAHRTGAADRLSASMRAALAAGGVATALAIAAAPLCYPWLVRETVRRFPTEVALRIRDAAFGSATTVGESTLFLLLAALCVALAVWILFVLRLGLVSRQLSRDSAGFSLAAVGLFVATVFTSTLGAPSVLVFAGIAASLVVWDADEFGGALGREVGQHARTRGTELVHAGTTLAVAAVGVALAVFAESVVSGTTIASPSVLALWSVVLGLLLLLVSLR